MTEGFKAAGLHTAMLVIPLLCFVLAIVLFAAARTVGADMERLRLWMRGDNSVRAAT
jgi:hypothetical protein